MSIRPSVRDLFFLNGTADRFLLHFFFIPPPLFFYVFRAQASLREGKKLAFQNDEGAQLPFHIRNQSFHGLHDVSYASTIGAFSTNGSDIKSFIDGSNDFTNNSRAIRSISFTIAQSTGRASVGLIGDDEQEGRYFENLFDSSMIRQAEGPVHIYISLKAKYAEFFRFTVLGAVKRAVPPLCTSKGARIQMTLRSASRSAALKVKGLLHLRVIALEAGISSYYYDTIIFPTLLLFKAPDVLLAERSVRLENAFLKLSRFIYPTAVTKGRVRRVRRPSKEAICTKILELFSRWCKKDTLEAPLNLLNFE